MKMTSWKSLLGSCAVIFLLASCAAPAFVKKDESVDFRNFKTFSWVNDESNGKRGGFSNLDMQKIQNATNQQLEKVGWNEAKRNPDVYLTYDLLVERVNKQEKDPVYSQPYSRLFYNPYLRRYGVINYPSQFMGFESYARTVNQGTITITMIDARTNKMIWQGWTTDEVKSRNLTNKEIQSSIKSIFRKFDVAKN